MGESVSMICILVGLTGGSFTICLSSPDTPSISKGMPPPHVERLTCSITRAIKSGLLRPYVDPP